MGYRDEKASLRARVAELERDLAAKEEEIARLKGGATVATTRDRSHSRVLDAPLAVSHERTLDHTIHVEGLEAIADVLRERLQLDVTQVGRALRGKRVGGLEFELVMHEGRTDLRFSADFRDRRDGLFVGGPVSGVLAGLVGAAILGPFAVAAPVVLGTMALLAVAATFGLVRLVRGVVRNEQAAIAGTLEAVLVLATEHAAKEPAIRARVQSEADRAVEVEDVPKEEHEAEA